MPNPLRLVLFGIGAAVILTVAGSLAKVGSIEEDLTARSKNDLADDSLSWAQVILSGRDATLSGTAPTQEARKLALKAVDRVWGVRRVSDRTELFPLQQPYRLTVSRNGDAVELSGFVPKSVSRDEMKKAAKTVFPDGGLTYDLPLARGAPPGLNAAVEFALDRLKDMTVGKVMITDRTIDITGNARDHDGFSRIETALNGGLPLGYRLGEMEIVPPSVKPYVWSANFDSGRVELGGYAVSNTDRQLVVAKVESLFLGATIEDNMKLGSGAPDGFSAAVFFALAQLSGFTGGQVSLEDLKLSISGSIDDITIYDAVSSALDGALPAGVSLTGRDIEKPVPPPPEPIESLTSIEGALTEPMWGPLWRLTRADDGVVLSGAVPDEAARTELMALARSKFGALAVHDRQYVLDDLPDGFIDTVRESLQAVSRLGTGRAEVAPARVSISGTAYYLAAAEAIRDNLLESLPAGFNAEFGDLSVQEPGAAVSGAECQQLFVTVLDSNQIQFETSKAVIQRDSFGLLDHLVYITQRCPNARVMIEGHTDSVGSDAVNQIISEQRAASVVRYLVDAGVENERLSPIGYGEMKPLAPNDTEDGKALNRRIEFRIVSE